MSRVKGEKRNFPAVETGERDHWRVENSVAKMPKDRSPLPRTREVEVEGMKRRIEPPNKKIIYRKKERGEVRPPRNSAPATLRVVEVAATRADAREEEVLSAN